MLFGIGSVRLSVVLLNVCCVGVLVGVGWVCGVGGVWLW